MTFRMVDLFSGICGFTYAAHQVWPDLETVLFCEMDEFCQKIIRKHYPGVPIISDIRDVTHESILADTGSLRNKTKSEPKKTGNQRNPDIAFNRGEVRCGAIDLLTGGFPCQPFSCAGKRQGDRDDRFLWPQLLRVIQEIHPTWLILENVAGIFSIFQYDSEPPLEDTGGAKGEVGDIYTRSGTGVLWEILEALETEGYDVQSYILPACSQNAPHRRDRVWIVGRINTDTLSDTDGGGEKINKANRLPQSRMGDLAPRISTWLAEPDIPRVATGVKDRVNKLKALGNAIVPQTVIPIMQAIKEIEEMK